MEASTCLEKLVGNSSVGVVLKDVSLQVHGGELMAVLGSKGMMAFLLILLSPFLFPQIVYAFLLQRDSLSRELLHKSAGNLLISFQVSN